MKTAMLLAIVAVVLPAQTPPTGSVSGRVIDADSGAGVPDFPVENNVRSDSRGYYKLTGIKPGPFEIRLRGQRAWPELNVTLVNVVAGQEAGGVDLRVRLDGEISGRVLDQNNDPVASMPVRAMGREYYAGALRYFGDTGSATTNDRGEFVLRNVRTGRALLLLAEKHKQYAEAISDAPADPQMRRPAYRATYYPNSPSVDGATIVTLRSGEHRASMDIHVLRSPAFCIDGTLMLDGAPASLNFKVMDELTQSANMIPGSGSSSAIAVSSGPDGRIRLCDFYPGQFRIAALRGASGNSQLFGATSVSIGKEDVHNVRVNASAPSMVQADVAWDGTPPETASQALFTLLLESVTNDANVGTGNRPRYPVPGTFQFPALQTVEYVLRPSLGPAGAFPNAYIKDVSYGPASILYRAFRAGEGTLRVTIGTAGGFLKATTPPGAQILILPDAVSDEALLAAAMVTGTADNNGAYTSTSLAPGKYHVFATNFLIDRTPECIVLIHHARIRGQAVEIAPNGTATVTVSELIDLQPGNGR